MASDLTECMAVVRALAAASRFRRWFVAQILRRRNPEVQARRLDGTRHRPRRTDRD